MYGNSIRHLPVGKNTLTEATIINYHYFLSCHKVALEDEPSQQMAFLNECFTSLENNFRGLEYPS